MSITWEFNEKTAQKLYNSNGSGGFSSKKEAKKYIKNTLANVSCPACGNRRMNGSGLIVDITKTKIYRQENKKGLMGSKVKDKFERTVYLISEPYLAPKKFLMGGGHIKCYNCGDTTKVSSGSRGFFSQWGKNLKDGWDRGDFK